MPLLNIIYIYIYIFLLYPICSMYGLLFTYIWLKCMVNVGKYSIHGAFGYVYVFVLL